MIDRFVETQARGDWREPFPEIAQYDPFDFAAEDELLSRISPEALAAAAGDDEFGRKLVARADRLAQKGTDKI